MKSQHCLNGGDTQVRCYIVAWPKDTNRHTAALNSVLKLFAPWRRKR